MAETSARAAWRQLYLRLALGVALLLDVQSAGALGLEVLSKASELRDQVGSPQRAFAAVRLEGLVLYVDGKRHRLAVQDSSGIAVLESEVAGPPLRAGDWVVLEGNCAIETGAIRLGRVPLVNNDGTHAANEKSGRAYLQAGRHPLRLDWFDAGGEVALEVDYQGPGLRRQRIPDSSLFRGTTNPAVLGANWTQGLDYKDYEGQWGLLTNFAQLVPVKQGTTPNFDLSIRSRANNVGVEFTGYVEIPRPGTYTFSVISDDGSLLFLDEAPARARVLRTQTLPAGLPLTAGRPWTNEPQWTDLEGKIVFAGRAPEGWNLELRSRNDERIDIELPDAPSLCAEQWLHSQVRVTGVLRNEYGSDGMLLVRELLVPGPEQVRLLQASAEQWARPLLSIVQVTHDQDLADTMVRVRGRVQFTGSGSSLVVADETGQLEAETSQPLEPGLSGWIELLGRCDPGQTNVTLKDSVVRRAEPAGYLNEKMLPVLTSVEQIHRLKREEAARGYPVSIRGIVTCSWDWNANGMIQDATRGIFVPNLAPGAPARVGDYLEVAGFTAAGDFAPVIDSTRVNLLGRADLPEPLRPTWDQLLNGSLDCQFVEIEGVVTSTQSNGITLRMRGGRLAVEIEDWEPADLRKFENSRVRVRGALSAVWDVQTHLVVSGRIFLHTVAISVEEVAPVDLFAIPEKQVDELKRFDVEAGTLQRVKLAGQIVHHRYGEYFLMEGTNGLRFRLAHEQPLVAGDLVEVVGFPEMDGTSPHLTDAAVRKTRTAALPQARRLVPGMSWQSGADATLVTVEARVLGARLVQKELIMELRAGPGRFLARLICRPEEVSLPAVGSLVRLTGVYSGESGGQDPAPADSFELLLNGPADVVVLQRPSWWTTGHALELVAVLVAILLLALVWIGSLRRTVGQRTVQLQAEIEHHKQTEAEVKNQAGLLAIEIEERKRVEQEVERVHKELLMTSRQAGMAEVATSILHNVGNVLNSVNVSATLIAEKLRQTTAATISRVAELLAEHAANPNFLVAHEKGKQVPGFLKNLGERLKTEQENNLRELQDLQSNIEHIKRIVAMQQDYARLGGLVEKIRLGEIVEDSIRINANALARNSVTLVRDFQVDPELLVEKHKVLQILVNLIQNARAACVEGQASERHVRVSIESAGVKRVKVSVIDNGMGISAENLKRIFTPGFTTRKDGHGFGLHGCILAAKDLQGELSVHSRGIGQGAIFSLELPLTAAGDGTAP